MIRFRKMSVQSIAAPVVVGPNNQTEIRRSYAILLLPINDNGDAIVGISGAGVAGMPGGMNGQIPVLVSSESEMLRFPDDSILVLSLENAPAAAAGATEGTRAMTSSEPDLSAKL